MASPVDDTYLSCGINMPIEGGHGKCVYYLGPDRAHVASRGLA